MKMTLKELNKKYMGLAALGNLTLPVKLRYAITCNLEAMQKHAERIEKTRKELCEQYCRKDEDGEPIMVDSIVNGVKRSEYDVEKKAEKAMNKEYEDFLETEEVEIDIRKVKFSILEECEEKDRYDLPNVAQQLSMNFMLEE